ncbi:hypothetical protein, partial [Prevotella sp.]|uniref:hypothetical protein n=1 Tax=Prevotella sp. TaxID=59823 RepID=UPI004024D3C0
LLLLEVFRVKRLWRPFFVPDVKVHDLLTERHEVQDLYFTWVFIFFIIASSLFVYQLVIIQKISCKFADAYYISY